MGRAGLAADAVRSRQGWPFDPRWTLVHLATLGLCAAVLLWTSRRMWFFLDEFTFFTGRMGPLSPSLLLKPHNGHWSTLPILSYRVLYGLFGIRSYLPYMVVLVVVHLAIVHVLWRVCRRVGVGPVATSVACLIFGFLGAGAENLYWAFQIGFLGSVLAAWSHALLVDHDRGWRARDALGVLVSVLGLMCSGAGVPLLVVPVVTAWIRRGLAAAVLTGLVPGAVFGLWYVTCFSPAAEAGTTLDRAHLPGAGAALGYVAAGVNGAATAGLGLPAGGLLLLAGLAAVAATRMLPLTGRAGMAAAGLAALLPLYGVIALGRAYAGADEAMASRYAYIASAVTLPACALAASRLTNRSLPVWRRLAASWPGWAVRWSPVGLVLLVAGVGVLGHNLVLLRQAEQTATVRDQQARTELLANVVLIRTGEPINQQVGLDALAGYSPWWALARMDADHALPGHFTVRAHDLADARVRAQVVINPGTGGQSPGDWPLAPLRLIATPGNQLEPTGRPPCVQVLPGGSGAATVVLVTTSSPGMLRIGPGVSGPLFARWQSSDGTANSDLKYLAWLRPGAATTVEYLSPVGRLLLRLPGRAPAELCIPAQAS